MARDEVKWAHWTKVINEWRGSGLTRNAYCPRPLFGRREGIKPSTLDYWRPLIAEGAPLTVTLAEEKLAKAVVADERITLVPVKVIDTPRKSTLEMLTLKSPAGWQIQLPAQADPNWLITVLRQLP